MARRPSRPRSVLMGLLVAASLLSFVGARYPGDLLLHHIGTAAGLAILVTVDRRVTLSTAAFGVVITFLAVHVVGARYLYSFVPYDEWSAALFGVTLSETFGWERNHYDRLVHLLYGACLAVPIHELLRGPDRMGARAALVATLTLIVATSALYELFEWGLAVALAPDSAERYNGQQGDPWDAQKDMALATLGTLLVAPWLARRAPPAAPSAPESA